MKRINTQTLITALIMVLSLGTLAACGSTPEPEERQQRDMLEGLDDARDRLDRQTN